MKKMLFTAIFLVNLVEAKISVVTTTYPIYSVVEKVAQDKIELKNLVPFGVEAHHYEPIAKDLVVLNSADIFIISSESLEPWSHKIIESMKIQLKTIDMSESVITLKDEDEPKDSHNHHHHEGDINPHYWLSFENYKKMIDKVEEILILKDKTNQEFYKESAKNYKSEVEKLQNEFNQTLNSCKNRKIVVNHDAFGYLANDYNITQIPIMGLSPDIQPSAKTISKIIKLVKEQNISTIFFEEFASDKVAKTIANETKAKTSVLNPIENLTKKQKDSKIGYLELMRENLKELSTAMECQK